MGSTKNTLSTVYYDVEIENELRFVVGEENAFLELLSGFAEIFGSELVMNEIYTFPPYSSVSLYTWHGCSVKLRGNIVKSQVLSDTLMMLTVNIHACLEEMRIRAEAENRKGPISLIVGPMKSGKSSFCRFLLNYAARLGRKPLYIDLDVSENASALPGAISILPVDGPSHVTDGFIQQALSVFSFGYLHPEKNISLYFLQIKTLGDILQKHIITDPKIRSSGVIIDTCGWVRQEGYTAITFTAYSFEIDVLFVIKDEILFLNLKKDMPSSVKVVFVPEQDGIIGRCGYLRTDIRAKRVWEYFYGSIKKPLNPYKFDVKFSDIEIYRADTKFSDKKAYTISVDDVKIIKVHIGPELLNRVFGLSFASEFDKNLLVTFVKGFVCILNVDMDKEIATVLSPQPGPLPGKFLLMGDIKVRNFRK